MSVTPEICCGLEPGAPLSLGSTNHAAVAFRTLNRFGGNQPRSFGYDRLHRRWVIGAKIERNRIRTATPAEVVAGLFDRAVPRGSGSAVPVLLLRGLWNGIGELNRWETVQKREAERVELARKFEEAKNAPQRQLIAAGRLRRCTGAGGFFGSHSPFAP